MNLKQKIAERFSKASDRYSESAILQRDIAARLIKLSEACIKPGSKIFDIGSGTGFIAEGLKKRNSEINIIQSDIAFGMCDISRKFSTVICADIEYLPFKKSSFDVVFSSSALQWLQDFERAFHNVKHILSQNGYFIFSCFGQETLKELKSLFQDLDIKSPLNDFNTMGDIARVAANAGFELEIFQNEVIEEKSDTALDAVRSIRDIGAGTSIKQSPVFTREVMNKLASHKNMVSTWEVFYFILKRV